MTPTLSRLEVLRDAVLPMTMAHSVDPFAVKTLPRYSPARVAWTVRSRWLDVVARYSRQRTADLIGSASRLERVSSRGAALEDTAVTCGQLELIKRGLASVAAVDGPVVEVGSYRGVTTRALAQADRRMVYAVDPFIGYGGSEADYAIFRSATDDLTNMTHLRQPSGRAALTFANGTVAFVFIDAVHDVSNSWFDCCTWSTRLAPGGMLALHDVDDHPGVGMSLRRLLATTQAFTLWGYCPNLVLLSKAGPGAG